MCAVMSMATLPHAPTGVRIQAARANALDQPTIRVFIQDLDKIVTKGNFQKEEIVRNLFHFIYSTYR